MKDLVSNSNVKKIKELEVNDSKESVTEDYKTSKSFTLLSLSPLIILTSLVLAAWIYFYLKIEQHNFNSISNEIHLENVIYMNMAILGIISALLVGLLIVFILIFLSGKLR